MLRRLKKIFTLDTARVLEGKNDKGTIPEMNFDKHEIQQIEDEIRRRFIGCFLGLAVGDAKGMPAESKGIGYGEYVAGTFDYLPGYLPAGHFTDDTHHATFLAESLFEKGQFDPKDFMEKMSKMDISRGYGPTTMKAVIRYMTGISHQESGLPSPGNGPSMRVAPLALFYHYDLDLLKKYARESAKVTHTHPEAIAGSMTVAFSVAYMLNHHREKFDKAKFLNELICFIEKESPELAAALKENALLMQRHGCRVLESVPHAIRIFLQDPYDFEKAVIQAIRGGGDADTIAAIVGAISGAFNGLDKIPQQWIERLENSPKGRDYIRKLANDLYELSKEKKRKKVPS